MHRLVQKLLRMFVCVILTLQKAVCIMHINRPLAAVVFCGSNSIPIDCTDFIFVKHLEMPFCPYQCLYQPNSRNITQYPRPSRDILVLFVMMNMTMMTTLTATIPSLPHPSILAFQKSKPLPTKASSLSQSSLSTRISSSATAHI